MLRILETCMTIYRLCHSYQLSTIAFRGPMRRFRMGFHGRNQLFARYNDAAASNGREGAAPKHIKVRRNHSWAFYFLQLLVLADACVYRSHPCPFCLSVQPCGMQIKGFRRSYSNPLNSKSETGVTSLLRESRASAPRSP